MKDTVSTDYSSKQGWGKYTPNIKPIRTRNIRPSRSIAIDQIAIDVMLQDEFRCIQPATALARFIITAPYPTTKGTYNKHIPIIKYLTSQTMSSHSPTILIILLQQSITTQHLSIEIKDLERGVVDVEFRTLEEEEAMMVNEFGAPVEVYQGCNVAPVFGLGELNIFIN